MGVAAKQSIVTTALNYLGVAIGAFNTLWLLPKAMTTGEIGLYRVIISMATLCVPFAQMGIIQSSIRYFPGYKSDQSRNRFLSALLLFAITGFVLFLVIFWIFRDPISSFFESRSPEVQNYYDLVVGLVFTMVFFGLLESFCRNFLQIAVPNFVKEVLLRFLTSVLILLFFLGILEFEQMLYLLIFNYSIAVLVLAVYLFSKYRIRPALSVKGINFSEMINYALFTILGTGGAMIVMQIDSILVTGLLGLDMNGIYATAFFIAIVVEIPRRGISQVSATLLSGAFHEKDTASVKRIYQKTSINLMLAAVLIYLLIVVNLDQLFYFIPDWQRFEAGKIVVLLVGFGKVIDLAFGVNTEVIIMSKYYRFNIFAILLLAVITVLTNLWLIPIYGLMGAALATMISFVIFNVAKFLFILIKLRIQPFQWKSLLVLIIGLISFTAVYFIPDLGLNFIVNIGLKSMVLISIFVSANLLLHTSEDLNVLLGSLINRIRGK